MATWQYDIHLLPSTYALEHRASIIASSESDLIDTSPAWVSYDRAKSLIDEISRVLPAASSWSSSIRVWGIEDSDRFEIVWSAGNIDDVLARIDVRKLSKQFLQSIVDLAKRHDLVLLTTNKSIIEPDLGVLLEAIKSSDAYRFVMDPTGFLERLETS